LTVDRLIGGDVIVASDNTSVSGGPNGIRTRVFSPPRAFVMVERSYAKLTKRCNLRDLKALVI